ncbi:hypothetical protein ADUPG1_004413 [Aduncisulcus paluster]|uniref:Uncharacterized protein n=1 Tax=Aduncisulcus paluster TaxID=2918883 RepID=A0ABQ5JZ88_9EUKA|nr:hypothetical protein ADUPG1_004413 [Aduncisulcus paluster]
METYNSIVFTKPFRTYCTSRPKLLRTFEKEWKAKSKSKRRMRSKGTLTGEDLEDSDQYTSESDSKGEQSSDTSSDDGKTTSREISGDSDRAVTVDSGGHRRVQRTSSKSKRRDNKKQTQKNRTKAQRPSSDSDSDSDLYIPRTAVMRNKSSGPRRSSDRLKHTSKRPKGQARESGAEQQSTVTEPGSDSVQAETETEK